MLWECPQCHFRDNRGLARHCTHCGRPKGADAVERMPDDMSEDNALSGEAQRKALAGPDWKCKYCNFLQNALGEFCQECGASRGEGRKDWDYKGPGEVVAKEAVEISRPSARRRRATIEVSPPVKIAHPATEDDCGFPEPRRGSAVTTDDYAPPVDVPEREFEPNTGGYRDPPKARTPAPVSAPVRPKDRGHLQGFLIGALVIALVGTAIWLLFRTKEYDVTVSEVSWKHDVVVYRLHAVRKQGWTPPPMSEDVRDEGLRFHHTDRLKVGSHKEKEKYKYDCEDHCTTTKGACRTVKGKCTKTKVVCKPNKNGTANCTGGDKVCEPDGKECDKDIKVCPKCEGERNVDVDDYQDFPVNRTWYSWTEWDWDAARTISASGNTIQTRWPSERELEPNPPLAPREQEKTTRVASYEVRLSHSRDFWTIRPKSVEEFSRYEPGSRFRIRVGAAQGVTVISGSGTTTDY